MNINHREENRRDITPKPRKPIHGEMGRYGINRSNANISSSNHDGVDETDNVMSKMARQSSPLTIRKNNKLKRAQRRNSFSNHNDGIEEEDVTDDSESEISSSLQKSWDKDNSHHYSSGSEDIGAQQTFSAEKSANISRSGGGCGNGVTKYIIICATLVFAVAFKVIFIKEAYNTQSKATQTINYDETLFQSNMDSLKLKYNIDDNSILKIKTGLSTIFSRMDAGSFVFLYNSKTDKFDRVRFKKFINEVARTAARYLRNNIEPIHHTVVVSSDLNMHEHSELINKYREDFDRTGVMLVEEVDAVPSDLAMAFHYYCDEYDPLVKRSAIFFTLNMANCSNTSDKKSMYDIIEKCLAKKWQSVPPENIRPLLTRIVDVIIDLTSVF